MLESELRLHEGKLEEAIARAREGVVLEETSASAQEQLGEALLLAGRLEEALPHFIEALGRGSLSALAGGVVALKFLETGKLPEARQVFRLQRRGAALGCALAHSATALIRLEENQPAESLELAHLAWREYSDLPAWADQPPVRALLLEALLRVLDSWLEQAPSGDPDLGAARELRRQVAEGRPPRTDHSRD